MAQSIQQPQHVVCQSCDNQMELYMARSEYNEIVMTFECSHCKQFSELVAKTKAPRVELELH